ncbi:hypothetical protein BCR44DRAFT_148470, partial [Catenaria anguillulae PL171]
MWPHTFAFPALALARLLITACTVHLCLLLVVHPMSMSGAFPAPSPKLPTVRGRPASVAVARARPTTPSLMSKPTAHIRFENSLRRLVLSSSHHSSSHRQRVFSLINQDPNSAFDLSLDCSAVTSALDELGDDPSAISATGIPPNQCQGVERSIRRAMQRIASEFRFRRPITLHVSMFIPCEDVTVNDEEQCSELNLLAEASITQRLPVRHLDDDQVYMYPTALLKQLDFDGLDKVEWPEYDVVMQINAKRNWWFGPDDAQGAGTDMPEGMRDLELTCMHEILHMSYGDDLSMTYQPNDKLEVVTPYYESAASDPLPIELEGTLAYNDGANFFRFSRPSIWDRFTRVTDTATAIRDYSANLTRVVDRLITTGAIQPRPVASASAMAAGLLQPGAYDPGSVFDALMGDSEGQRLISELYQLGTTSGAVVFDPTAWPPSAATGVPQTRGSSSRPGAADPPVSPMETGISPFTPGSSVSHFGMPTPGDTDVNSAPLNSSAEFLMFWRAGSISLDRLIRESGAPASGIGPATKAAMVAMGFTPAEAYGWNERRAWARLELDDGRDANAGEEIDIEMFGELTSSPASGLPLAPRFVCGLGFLSLLFQLLL